MVCLSTRKCVRLINGNREYWRKNIFNCLASDEVVRSTSIHSMPTGDSWTFKANIAFFIFAWVFRTSGSKIGALGGNRGRGALLTPNELVLTFGGLCPMWWKSTKRCDRESVHRRTDTRTDARRFYYMSHAICYSYGADKNKINNRIAQKKRSEPKIFHLLNWPTPLLKVYLATWSRTVLLLHFNANAVINAYTNLSTCTICAVLLALRRAACCDMCCTVKVKRCIGSAV